MYSFFFADDYNLFTYIYKFLLKQLQFAIKFIIQYNISTWESVILNKIKKIWNENKVLFVLGIILLICVIIIGVIAIKSFYSSCDDAYCNRRVDEVRSSIPTDIKETLTSNENVTKVSVLVKNAIIYVSATFKNEVKMDDAKKVMNDIIPLFTEQELLTYDLDLTIKTEDTEKGYIIKGARNTNGNGNIIWSNYNQSTDKESSEKE